MEEAAAETQSHREGAIPACGLPGSGAGLVALLLFQGALHQLANRLAG